MNIPKNNEKKNSVIRSVRKGWLVKLPPDICTSLLKPSSTLLFYRLEGGTLIISGKAGRNPVLIAKDANACLLKLPGEFIYARQIKVRDKLTLTPKKGNW